MKPLASVGRLELTAAQSPGPTKLERVKGEDESMLSGFMLAGVLAADTSAITSYLDTTLLSHRCRQFGTLGAKANPRGCRAGALLNT